MRPIILIALLFALSACDISRWEESRVAFAMNEKLSQSKADKLKGGY